MAVTKAYFMLMVRDMDRATRFYEQALELEARFESPDWTELAFGDATVALHSGSSGEVADTGLGFETDDAAGLCRAVAGAGGTVVSPPEERGAEGILLATAEDTEGNRFSISQAIR